MLIVSDKGAGWLTNWITCLTADLIIIAAERTWSEFKSQERLGSTLSFDFLLSLLLFHLSIPCSEKISLVGRKLGLLSNLATSDRNDASWVELLSIKFELSRTM